MKLVETYYFKVVVPIGYEDEILDSIVKVVPLTWGNYDRLASISSPKKLQGRVLSGANPNLVSRDGPNIVAEEGVLIQSECVTVEFSIPRDDTLMRSVIEDGIFPAHPWEEPVVFVYPVLETRRCET